MRLRLMSVLLVAALCAFAPARAEKYEKMPDVFAMSVKSEERKIGKNVAYVYKEYLNTVNDTVNAELAEIVDGFDESLSGTLPEDPRKNGKRNSRLDIDTVYYRTGDGCVSTMIMARIGVNLAQTRLEFETRAYDLQTGGRILLTDIFAPDSAAWDMLAQGVREHMNAIYPSEERDADAIEALCERSALESADFTLSAMELTLHYHASDVFEGKTGIVHVRFFYPDFEGMMTEAGASYTDNSRWKMVAITCDDGPNYLESNKAINNFRMAGARVTYFLVGKMLEQYPDTFVKQFDQNHIFGSHSFHHWSGYTMKPETCRDELAKSDELTMSLSGERARYFRAPGGTYPPWVEADIGLPIIQWSLDTYDYTGKNAKRIYYSVRNNIDDGDIILCHDTGLQLHKAIPLFAEYLTENGYMMVTLDELARYKQKALEPNGVYHRFDDNPLEKQH